MYELGLQVGCGVDVEVENPPAGLYLGYVRGAARGVADGEGEQRSLVVHRGRVYIRPLSVFV